MSNIKPKKQLLFGKRNYRFLMFSILLITLGFILMSGGGSDDPNVFNPEIFNFRRIRLAPTVILIGFAMVIYAILTAPKKSK
tara:strand:- start:491 stop:736 length:246 start_codon:yes stop_codon:yes gene_type:complete